MKEPHSPTPTGRCALTGKANYHTRGQAKKHAKQYGGETRPYRCEGCGYFHLGHLKGFSRFEHRQHARSNA